MITALLLLQLLGQPLAPPGLHPPLPPGLGPVPPPSTPFEQGGIDLHAIDTQVTIGADGITVSATAVITFSTTQDLQTGFYLYMDEGLSFYTVSATAYTPILDQQLYSPFTYATVSFAETIPAGTSIRLTLGYSGTLQCNPYGVRGGQYCGGNDAVRFYREGGLFLMLLDYLTPNSTLLYDRHLTVRAPTGLDLLPSADFVSESTQGEWTTSTFTASPYTSGMSLLLLTGQFDFVEVEGSTPPARVYYPEGNEEWAVEMAQWSAKIFTWLEEQSRAQLPFGQVNIFKLPYMEGFPGTASYGMVYLSEAYDAYGPEWFEEILAHEISHLWWGILAYPSDIRSNMLMVEGMAVFSQYDYIYDTYYSREEKETWLWNKYRKNQLLLWYLTDPKRLPSIVLKPGEMVPNTLNEQVVWSYFKTSAFLDFLRVIIGDEAFHNGLSGYIQECVPNACNATDVQLLMEEASGRDLTALFSQFVYESNYPLITMGFVNTAGEVVITLRQERALELPLLLHINLTDGTTLTEEFTLTSSEQQVTLPVAAPVATVTLHPRLHIFYRFRSALPGDINYDMEVDGLDLITLGRRTGQIALTSQTPSLYDLYEEFDTRCDFVLDGVIDESDMAYITQNFGTLYGGDK